MQRERVFERCALIFVFFYHLCTKQTPFSCSLIICSKYKKKIIYNILKLIHVCIQYFYIYKSGAVFELLFLFRLEMPFNDGVNNFFFLSQEEQTNTHSEWSILDAINLFLCFISTLSMQWIWSFQIRCFFSIFFFGRWINSWKSLGNWKYVSLNDLRSFITFQYVFKRLSSMIKKNEEKKVYF